MAIASSSKIVDSIINAIPTVVIGTFGVAFAMYTSQKVADERYATIKIQVEEMKTKLDTLNDSVQRMIGANAKK